MQDTFFIKPRPGVKVRDPKDGKHLPDAGAEKPRNSYWLRRLRDKDVIETTKPKQAVEAPRAAEMAKPKQAPKAATPKEQ